MLFTRNCRPQDGKKKQWFDQNKTPPGANVTNQ